MGGPSCPFLPAPLLTWDASPLPLSPEFSWGAMNSYRDRGVTCTSSDLLDGSGGGRGLSQHTQFHHTPNGHPSTGLSDQAMQSRVSVPKMGVRARIAEWPPRRAQSRESLLENGQTSNGSSHHGEDCSTSVSSSVLSSETGLVRGGVARLPRRRSKDVEFRGGGFGDERGSSLSLRVLPPLRQRSNSELTLSEQDETEVSLILRSHLLCGLRKKCFILLLCVLCLQSNELNIKLCHKNPQTFCFFFNSF